MRSSATVDTALGATVIRARSALHRLAEVADCDLAAGEVAAITDAVDGLVDAVATACQLRVDRRGPVNGIEPLDRETWAWFLAQLLASSAPLATQIPYNVPSGQVTGAASDAMSDASPTAASGDPR